MGKNKHMSIENREVYFDNSKQYNVHLIDEQVVGTSTWDIEFENTESKQVNELYWMQKHTNPQAEKALSV